ARSFIQEGTLSKRKSKEAKRTAERAVDQGPERKPEQLSLGTVEASVDNDTPAEADGAGADSEAAEPAEPSRTPERSEPAEPAGADGEAAEATDDPPVVLELVNAHDGCWMRLANGDKVELTDRQWRQEMSRLIARKPSRPALG
ncbi:MAG: hypothetical protein O7A67_06400, partial [SAR324 cluster bacterium]|nr:hypothetical protein [SAR324 cluster bacterium]